MLTDVDKRIYLTSTTRIYNQNTEIVGTGDI